MCGNSEANMKVHVTQFMAIVSAALGLLLFTGETRSANSVSLAILSPSCQPVAFHTGHFDPLARLNTEKAARS